MTTIEKNLMKSSINLISFYMLVKRERKWDGSAVHLIKSGIQESRDDLGIYGGKGRNGWIKEQAITNLSDLLTQFRLFSTLIPKAKTAQTVPEIIDAVAKIPGTAGLQIALCKEMAESKIFFGGEYSEALDLLSRLVKELFETALMDFKAQLEEDPIVHRHLLSLHDTLLEQNLCSAMVLTLLRGLEKKLSQMILDKKIGTLDQGGSCLSAACIHASKELSDFCCGNAFTISSVDLA
ncbi:hypothetical protein POTOM_031401 [Populus tomentosa]|uniref:26S proteasome regulatory subunit Rpn6 N-terminal domain-containing protein n=1 Tax=Populus tomentosa TaxID=118781 RepID=A0A8X7Z7N5_POPTO|nr:hypothetical protein POTOM_031401 [Populus tomentosa]